MCKKSIMLFLSLVVLLSVIFLSSCTCREGDCIQTDKTIIREQKEAIGKLTNECADFTDELEKVCISMLENPKRNWIIYVDITDAGEKSYYIRKKEQSNLNPKEFLYYPTSYRLIIDGDNDNIVYLPSRLNSVVDQVGKIEDKEILGYIEYLESTKNTLEKTITLLNNE